LRSHYFILLLPAVALCPKKKREKKGRVAINTTFKRMCAPITAVLSSPDPPFTCVRRPFLFFAQLDFSFSFPRLNLPHDLRWKPFPPAIKLQNTPVIRRPFRHPIAVAGSELRFTGLLPSQFRDRVHLHLSANGSHRHMRSQMQSAMIHEIESQNRISDFRYSSIPPVASPRSKTESLNGLSGYIAVTFCSSRFSSFT